MTTSAPTEPGPSCPACDHERVGRRPLFALPVRCATVDRNGVFDDVRQCECADPCHAEKTLRFLEYVSVPDLGPRRV